MEPKKSSLLLRLAVFILVLGFTPFFVAGMHKEGKDFGIFFFLACLIIVLPELYIKLFSKPVSAVFEESQVIIKYYSGAKKKIQLTEIEGYSQTEEQTNYGKTSGVLLYVKNGSHIEFTEINIKDISPLLNYLNISNVPNYGFEKIGPWFLLKYKYRGNFKS